MSHAPSSRQEDVNVAAFDWGKFAALDDYALVKGTAPIVAAHLANLILKLEGQTNNAAKNGSS